MGFGTADVYHLDIEDLLRLHERQLEAGSFTKEVLEQWLRQHTAQA